MKASERTKPIVSMKLLKAKDQIGEKPKAQAISLSARLCLLRQRAQN
jgi:hypothetical protein